MCDKHTMLVRKNYAIVMLIGLFYAFIFIPYSFANGQQEPRTSIDEGLSLRIGLLDSGGMSDEIPVSTNAFTDYIQGMVGIPVTLHRFSAGGYSTLAQAFISGEINAMRANQLLYLQARNESSAWLIAAERYEGNEEFTTIPQVFVRRDSEIKAVEDLRGLSIAAGDPLSSTYTSLVYDLHNLGLIEDNDPLSFFGDVIFVNHGPALLSLVNGNVDAVISFDAAPSIYLKELSNDVVPIFTCTEIPNITMVVHGDLPTWVTEKFRRALFELTAPVNRAALDAFYPFMIEISNAHDADMDEVREMYSLLGF